MTKTATEKFASVLEIYKNVSLWRMWWHDKGTEINHCAMIAENIPSRNHNELSPPWHEAAMTLFHNNIACGLSLSTSLPVMRDNHNHKYPRLYWYQVIICLIHWMTEQWIQLWEVFMLESGITCPLQQSLTSLVSLYFEKSTSYNLGTDWNRLALE